MKKSLRIGFTTGACATAVAKAATQLLVKIISYETKGVNPEEISESIKEVDLLLPEGLKASFKINRTAFSKTNSKIITQASTIKFAGDDPDVTNGAEIIAQVISSREDLRFLDKDHNCEICRSSERAEESVIIIEGGGGVGVVTKPGLPVPVGMSAINPIPQKMIKRAVIEALEDLKDMGIRISNLKVIVSVTDGEKLALKTLNPRLGIVGGISILGTTGVVKPLSAEAWTATISTSMNVAKASGCEEIVLSTGRVSEKAHMKRFNLPVESYVMMGDYLEFSLLETRRHNFKRIHISAQWGKFLKVAMAIPQTHVRYGSIDIKKTLRFLEEIGISIPTAYEFNTARELFYHINSIFAEPLAPMRKVCMYAKRYAQEVTEGTPVICHLVNYDGEIILSV